MAKIARPALYNAIQVYKKEWGDITILSLKTYLMAALIYGIGVIPTLIFVGPENFIDVLTGKLNILDIPLYGRIIELCFSIAASFLTMWLFTPLYISISRSVVLASEPTQKEAFDCNLFNRLLNHRTLQVMKIFGVMVLLIIPINVVVYLFGIHSSADTNTSLSLLFLFYCIIYTYFTIRLTYLVPAFAVEHQFESATEAWNATKGKFWPVFKTSLFIIFLSVIVLALLIFAVVILGSAAVYLFKMIGVVIPLALTGFVTLLMTFLSILIFLLIAPPLMIAGIAYVYLSFQKPPQPVTE